MKSTALWTCFLCVIILSGCSSSSDQGLSQSKEASNEVTPLSIEECLDRTYYQWVADSCTLIDNPAVRNVEYIEALPEADHQDLIQWLTSIGKSVTFEAMMPRFDSPQSMDQPDTSPALESKNIFLDANRLSQALDNKSYLRHNGQTVTLGDAGPADADKYYLAERSKQYTVNDNILLDKQAALEISNGFGIVSLFGKEIYRFRLIERINATGHFGRLQAIEQAQMEPLVIESNPSYRYAGLNRQPFTQIMSQAFEPGEDTRQWLSKSWGLSTAQAALIKLDPITHPPSTASLELPSGERYFATSAQGRFYPDRAQMEAWLDAGHSSVNLTSYWQSRALPPLDIEATPHYWQHEGTLSFDINHVEPGQLRFENLVFTSDDLSVKPASIEEAIARVLEINEQMLNSPDLPESPAQRFHYPSFDQLIANAKAFKGPQRTLFTKALFENTKTVAVLADKASSRYIGVYSEITPDNLTALNQWNVVQPLQLGYLLREDPETGMDELSEIINRLAGATEYPAYYFALDTELRTLFQDLNEKEIDYYGSILVNIAAQAQYRGLTVDFADDLHRGIDLAGLEFREALAPVLRELSEFQYKGSQWQLSEFYLDRLKNINLYLSEAVKSNLIRHDALAGTYGIQAMIPGYLHKTIGTPDYAEAKTDALVSIDQFYQANSTDSPVDVSRYIRGRLSLAARAYQEEWHAGTFGNLTRVSAFAYPTRATGEARCREGGIFEQFDCLSNVSGFNQRLSKARGTGYLADYSPDRNPFAERAEDLVAVRKIYSEIDSIQPYYRLNSDYTKALVKGLWLECPADQVHTQLTKVKETSEALLSSVQAEPLPSYGSEVWREQKDLRDKLEVTLINCSTS